MLAVGGAEILAGSASEFGDDLGESGAADAESAFIMGGEGLCGKETCGESGVRKGEQLQVVADETEFLKLFRSGSYGIGELDEGAHERDTRARRSILAAK